MIYIILFFISIVMVDCFLWDNIKNLQSDTTGTHGMSYLLISITILFLLFSFFNFKSKKIAIKKSFLVLVVFFIYFAIKIFFDMKDIKRLVAYTIATTNGIIFFYSIGALISIALYRCVKLIYNSERLFRCFFYVFGFCMVFHILISFDAFIYLFGHIRNDIFKISNLKSNQYQRPGDFILISTLLILQLEKPVLLINNRYRIFFKNPLLVLYATLCTANMLLLLLLTQLISSNKGFAGVGGLLFLNILFYFITLSPSIKRILKCRYYKIKDFIVGIPGKKIVGISLISVFFFLLLLISLVKILGFDLSRIRITGYGTGHISSIESRIELLSSGYLVKQLSHSYLIPFIGNMSIDIITETVYIHSFIISIFTHLGLLGIIVFLFYLFYLVREINKMTFSSFYSNGMRIYTVCVFSGIFLLAVISVFFPWGPIWFLIGLISSPISQKSNRSRKC